MYSTYNYTRFVKNVSRFTQNRGSYLLTTHVLIENTAKHQSVIRLRGVSCPLPVSLAAKQFIFGDMVFFPFEGQVTECEMLGSFSGTGGCGGSKHYSKCCGL